ncbi:MAG: hypothetical protein AAF708_00405 [Deinococcota bacterium]
MPVTETLPARKSVRARVDVDTTEPATVAALFDLVRREASYYGFPDIMHVLIQMTIEVETSGLEKPPRANFEGLKERLDQLWCASGVSLKTER